MKRRFWAGLLSFMMLWSLLPASALAVGPMRVIKNQPDTADTYLFKDGETVVSSQTIKAGGTLVQPETPSQEGWHFIGWKNDENEEPPFGTVTEVTGATHTYTAQWEQAYYVYFMASNAANETEVIYSEQVKPNGCVTHQLPVCHTEHQRNAGWTADGKEFKIDTPVTKDTVVVPVMHDCWWVTFDTQGGQPVVSQYVEQGHSLNSLPEAQRTGYTFKGWSTQKDGGELVKTPFTPTGAVTLYAQWEPAEVNYTIV